LTVGGTAVSLAGHTHDDRYFTESESDARFAAIGHGHAASAITAGTFAAGDFTFPADLIVTSQLFFLSTAGDSYIAMKDSAGTNIRLLQLASDNNVYFGAVDNPASAGNVVFRTQGADRMTLTGTQLFPNTTGVIALGDASHRFTLGWYEAIHLIGSTNPYYGLNDGTYQAYFEIYQAALRVYFAGTERITMKASSAYQNAVRGQWAHWHPTSGTAPNSFSSGTSFTFDADNGNIQKISNTGTVTSITWSNLVEGSTYVLVITAGTGAGASWTWGATVKWDGGAPSLPTTSGEALIVTMYYNGTSLLASATGVFA
jgi:hypothetical protein